MEDLAIKFRKARAKAGDTQIQASRRLGISLSTVSKIDNKGIMPSHEAGKANVMDYLVTFGG